MEQLKPKSKDKAKPDLTKVHVLHPKAPANGPSDDMVLIFAGKIIEQNAILKAGRNKLKSIRQQAKNAGVGLDRLERAQRFADGNGIEALIAEYQETMRYTGILLGAPIGEQLEFFASGNKSGSQEDLVYAAFHKGRTRALLGQEPDSQAYPPTTDLGQEHLKGWNDGDQQRHLQEKLTENSEAAAAEEKRKADEAKKAKKDKKTAGTDATVKIIEGTLNKLEEEPADADT